MDCDTKKMEEKLQQTPFLKQNEKSSIKTHGEPGEYFYKKLPDHIHHE